MKSLINKIENLLHEFHREMILEKHSPLVRRGIKQKYAMLILKTEQEQFMKDNGHLFNL